MPGLIPPCACMHMDTPNPRLAIDPWPPHRLKVANSGTARRRPTAGQVFPGLQELMNQHRAAPVAYQCLPCAPASAHRCDAHQENCQGRQRWTRNAEDRLGWVRNARHAPGDTGTEEGGDQPYWRSLISSRFLQSMHSVAVGRASSRLIPISTPQISQ